MRTCILARSIVLLILKKSAVVSAAVTAGIPGPGEVTSSEIRGEKHISGLYNPVSGFCFAIGNLIKHERGA